MPSTDDAYLNLADRYIGWMNSTHEWRWLWQWIKYKKQQDDDFKQDLLLALVRAKETFDPDLGVPFEAYAWISPLRSVLTKWKDKYNYEKGHPEIFLNGHDEDKREIGEKLAAQNIDLVSTLELADEDADFDEIESKVIQTEARLLVNRFFFVNFFDNEIAAGLTGTNKELFIKDVFFPDLDDASSDEISRYSVLSLRHRILDVCKS